MRILFISDQHYRLGPLEPIRPELRRNLRWLNGPGHNFIERFENRLRLEADRVITVTENWLRDNDWKYDTIINGGDVAMPLSRHEDRMTATRKIWAYQLRKYTEEKLVVLTGNHELGHGYQADPKSYPDLLELRKKMFSREINRKGYGYEKFNGGILLAIDSELISMYQHDPINIFIRDKIEEMRHEVSGVLELFSDNGKSPAPIAIVTHNTYMVRQWLNLTRLLPRLTANDRHIALIGGHYHIPRSRRLQNLDIYWSGGASYPEPWLRFMTRVPFMGIKCCGPGAIEFVINQSRVKVKHKPFGIWWGDILPNQ